MAVPTGHRRPAWAEGEVKRYGRRWASVRDAIRQGWKVTYTATAPIPNVAASRDGRWSDGGAGNRRVLPRGPAAWTPARAAASPESVSATVGRLSTAVAAMRPRPTCGRTPGSTPLDSPSRDHARGHMLVRLCSRRTCGINSIRTAAALSYLAQERRSFRTILPRAQ